jgi:pimeloyl-ACP methyl ester carboxylesterase
MALDPGETRKMKSSEEKIDVGEDSLLVRREGSGPPLLVLHEELGCPGPLAWEETLAQRRTLLIPQHPGFGRSEPSSWIANVRDLACFYARYLREQRIAPVDVIGFSFGGWIAAEMAAGDPALFSRMVLVGAMGIRPPEGEILDMFVLTAESYLRASVLDPEATEEFPRLYGAEITPEQFEAFEDARAQVARLAWQPYLFNPSLPHLLGAVDGSRTLIVWGERDAVVPRSAGEAYRRAIPGSKLAVIPASGHRPEIERRQAFLAALSGFLD